MKKIFAVIVLVLIVGVALYYGAFAKDSKDAKAPPPPAEVSVITLKVGDISYYQELPGRTNAYKVSEIRPQVNGIIEKRLFTEGSEVKVGDQLYQIENAPYKAAYNSAKADLLKAQANVKSVESKSGRYADLVKIDAVSKQEYDDIVASLAQAKADVAIAEAQVATAKINLDYTKVYAPISGRIGKSNITEGALVTANQVDAIATITQLDPIYVDLTQSNKELISLREKIKGQQKTSVSLFVEESTTPYAHEGEIQFSDVTVDPSTGSLQLRSLFPNPEGELLPGLFVKARIKLNGGQGITVPQRAAIRGADGNLGVWVVSSDNKVKLQPIETERAIDDQWVVKSGVNEGDVIIVKGFQKITPESVVKPVPYVAEKSTESASSPAKPKENTDTKKEEAKDK